MSVWRAWLCCGVVLTQWSCGSRPTTVREESAVRTKGGDSATLHIQALITGGQLTKAEALLVEAIAAGLVSREAATRLQKTLRERQQQPSQRPDPERSPPAEPWVDMEDPSGERRACGNALPGHPVCQDLPEDYTHHSVQQALSVMKQRLGTKDLALHSPAATQTGPCPIIGEHRNVRRNGERVGSIVCCPCCVAADPRPIVWTRCRIVW